MMVTVLIQADLTVFLVVTPTLTVSTLMGNSLTGGVLQLRAVLELGSAFCTATASVSFGLTTLGTSAYKLVASWMIKVCINHF